MTRPALFGEDGFEEAARRAEQSGRWLIVDATAAWCQPCKLMDRTTWSDPAVAAWIAAHAVAVQVDVDADHTISGKLAIAAMPTVIAFREGRERDRVVGYKNAAGLLEWLGGLEQGETGIDRMRRLLPSTAGNMQGRLEFARALLHGRRLDEATDEYLWLWNNMTRIEPEMVGVRVSFMASEIASLVGEHAGARQRFTALRDEAQARLEREPSSSDVRLDWLVLNQLLGDDARAIAWFDAVKDQPAGSEVLEEVAHLLVPKLRALGRWADIGRLHRDPIAILERAHEMIEPEGLPPEMLEQLRGMMASAFREEAALLVASLRAAGRNEESAAVEREALGHDPSEEMRSTLADTLAASQGGGS